MQKTIVGTFYSRDDATNVTYKLRNEGFDTENISIIGNNHLADEDYDLIDESNAGMTAGTALGGIAGILIGASTFTLPGIGLVAAAGPIAGLISGALTGGVVGALVDIGIPEINSVDYEDNLKDGMYLLTVKTDDYNVDTITNIISSYNAESIDVY